MHPLQSPDPMIAAVDPNKLAPPAPVLHVGSPEPPASPELPAQGEGGRSTGSLRERRPGVWEIRIAVGRDPLAGTPRQRSFTVHGTRADAEAYPDRVLAEAAAARLPSARHLDLARLLQAWLDAEQDWKPSTRVGYRSVVRFLTTDPLGHHRAAGLTHTSSAPPSPGGNATAPASP